MSTAAISAAAVLAELDRRSRERRLTDLESVWLEHAIGVVDKGEPFEMTAREAARLGMKRDMGAYRR